MVIIWHNLSLLRFNTFQDIMPVYWDNISINF